LPSLARSDRPFCSRARSPRPSSRKTSSKASRICAGRLFHLRGCTMLMKSQPPPPAVTHAYIQGGFYRITLTSGLRCPFCERELKATDVDIDGLADQVRLICRGEDCHRTVLDIGREIEDAS